MQKPDYYAKLAIDPLEYAYKNKLNPYQFNAIKYITRYKDKNGIEDLKKAIHCIEEYKQQLSTNNTNIRVINCIDKTLKHTNLDAIPVNVLPNGCKVKEINSFNVSFAIDPYEYAYKNKIGEKETNIIRCIMFAKHKGAMDNLNEAIRDLTELRRSEEERGLMRKFYSIFNNIRQQLCVWLRKK